MAGKIKHGTIICARSNQYVVLRLQKKLNKGRAVVTISHKAGWSCHKARARSLRWGITITQVVKPIIPILIKARAERKRPSTIIHRASIANGNHQELVFCQYVCIVFKA